MALLDAQSRPLGTLTFLFTTWKAFLLSIALASSIAPDYDTSTSLFFQRLYETPPAVSSLSHRLTRWDALYFIHASRIGKLYEQEWAFGHGQSSLVSYLASLTTASEPVLAITVANASHLLSVIALYHLTILVSRSRDMAFVSCVLHILSPAGLFLSAPYSESACSCLTFVGNWLFALSCKNGRGDLKRSACIVMAGVVFGLATVFRSNGLGNGLLFAVEAVNCLAAFSRKPSLSSCAAMIAPIIGGVCVAIGAAAPQVVAYLRYCGEDSLRPWCTRTVPSIYSFVQEYYWNVGFLRYWTANQIPLFLLAAPVLYLLIASGFQLLRNPFSTFPLLMHNTDSLFVRSLAAIQTIVALMAITSYHVQIINRLASGYVVWYWWISGLILDERKSGFGSAVVMFFVMYAGIQGCLFASFLPPA